MVPSSGQAIGRNRHPLPPKGPIPILKQSSVVQRSPSSQSSSVLHPGGGAQVSKALQRPKEGKVLLQKSTVQSSPSSQQAGFVMQKLGLKGVVLHTPWSHVLTVQGSLSVHFGIFAHAPLISQVSIVQTFPSLQHTSGFRQKSWLGTF